MVDNPLQTRLVAVFGSSRTRPEELEYGEARRLGRLLAEHGWTICNGGHDGTMEAAARGASEGGGRTIGVTLDLYRPLTPNPWLNEEILTQSLFARLERLARMGDAYIVLRGGIGTLLELCLAWNLVQSREFAAKPLIVVGPHWAEVVRELRAQLPMRADESNSVILVDTVDEAVERLEMVTAARAAADALPGA